MPGYGFEPQPPRRLSGDKYVGDDAATITDFWSWADSDLRDNVTRGVLAEYIVGLALTCVSGVRSAWGDCDLVTRAGTRVEVKAAAYLQSWRTETLSTIGFGGLRGRAWDPVTGFAPEPSYRADVYVFALLTTADHALLDPLATDQWEFFVASHAAVGERRKATLTHERSANRERTTPLGRNPPGR